MDLFLSSAMTPKLLHFDEISSTNDYLFDQAGADLQSWPDHSVVCASMQTRGRGRNQREWESPSGASLSFSILIRNSTVPAHWYGILLAMAATKSLNEQGVQAGLKWPNDVLVDDKKLAGVLGQAAENYLVVGLGLNLSKVEITGSTSLEDFGLKTDFDFQLSGILSNFSQIIERQSSAGLTDLLPELRQLSHALGRRVRITLEGEDIEGLATDIDSEGKLIIDNGRFAVSAGDIMHLRGVG